MDVVLVPVMPDPRLATWAAVALLPGVLLMMSTEVPLAGTREATKRTFGYVLLGAATAGYADGVAWASLMHYSWVLIGVVTMAYAVFIWFLTRSVNLRHNEWPTTKTSKS
jgi:hypothetical protein